MIRRFQRWSALLAMGVAPVLVAEQPKRGGASKPFQVKAQSSVAFNNKDGAETVEITNVTYEVAGPGIPGRAPDERLLVRRTIRTKQAMEEVGMEATSTVDVWPLGTDPRLKPIYSLTVSGSEAKIMAGELVVVSRGLEEVDWWSVHKLGTGEHLFDTYVAPLEFSITRDSRTMRYIGLEVPPDDTADARLKHPNVFAVLTYASGEGVIREALITCKTAKQAQMFRSFADATRNVTLLESPRAIRISISQNYPSAPATITMTVPIAKDDLDLTHVQAPTGVRIIAWKRN